MASDFERALLAGAAWIASTQIPREEVRRVVQFVSIGGVAYFGARAMRKAAAGIPVLGELVLGVDESEGAPVDVPSGWNIPIPPVVPSIPPPPQSPPMVGEYLAGPKTSPIVGRIIDPPTGGSVSRALFASSVELELELSNWAGSSGSALVDVILSWSSGVAKGSYGPFEIDGRSTIRVPVKVGLGGTPFSPWLPKVVASSVIVNGKSTQTSEFTVE